MLEQIGLLIFEAEMDDTIMSTDVSHSAVSVTPVLAAVGLGRRRQGAGEGGKNREKGEMSNLFEERGEEVTHATCISQQSLHPRRPENTLRPLPN